MTIAQNSEKKTLKGAKLLCDPKKWKLLKEKENVVKKLLKISEASNQQTSISEFDKSSLEKAEGQGHWSNLRSQ